jgi:asparagine synthase (glutamine-hydrolysing)
LFARFLDRVDQPTIDGFNTFCVAGLAREHGMKVVLSGLGADELFGGYPTFARLPQLHGMSRMLGPLRAVAGALLRKIKDSPPLVRLGSALCEGGTWSQLYDAFRGVYGSVEARQLAEWLTGKTVQENQSAEDSGAPRDPADRVSAMELSRYMRNQLLRDGDVMSMAHGLELRLPFVDSGLFDVMSRVPAKLRLQPGKQLLLDAVPEIPEWVRSRPKSGFLFPYEQWLSTPEWQRMFAEALRDLPVPAQSWYQRWAVFMLGHWQQARGMARSCSSSSD